jgi:hypothetical protein
MGVAYSSIGQPEKALEFHQRALERYRESGSRRNEGIALGNIGHVYGLLGDPQKAFDFHNQGLMVFRTLGDRENEASMLEGLARAERGRGNLEAARKFIDETLTLREALRTQVTSQQLRSSYLSTRQDAYQFYIDLLIELQRQKPSGGYDAEALRISEKSRARSLAEMLNEAHADIRKGISSEVLAREREIKQLLNAKAQRQIQLKVQKANQVEIATLDKEISALEDEYQQVQIAIRQASPAYAALTQPQPLSAREIQQQLDPYSVLLEYSLGEERSYLWVVSADAIKTYELPKQPDIEKVARQVYESLTARSVVNGLETPEQRQERVAQADKQFQESAAQLSQMVLAPAASELGTKRLIVVADGVLQYVPFAALTVGSGLTTIVQLSRIMKLSVCHRFSISCPASKPGQS